MANAEKRLADIDEAIHVVMTGGQRYKIKDRELQRADLATLNKMRAEAAAEVEAENSGGGLGRRNAAVFFDRR